MLVMAHIGIGTWLARPWRRKLPWRPLAIGTLLPDLLDKPIYYGQVLLTGKHGAELGLFSGTRTFGHSLFFLVILLLGARLAGSRVFLALAAGVATHLILDNYLEPFSVFSIYSSRIALFFPAYGLVFPVAKHPGLGEHLLSHLRLSDIMGECAGLLLLARERLFIFRAIRRGPAAEG